ncbi:serine hydrolase domain-containing protein [Paenibacillus apiarius]|uniref:Beta-lactamase family protein n=1 Tax=Paenibacillus apiarius TaxID=46240 RepID=A0ABT4DY60_9BACL|nr:serine hydrolase domain-containing protein [Paenibacillus apiarius]MCY9517426.1 beta-lactamase family protein [Paenibacillus apiarius]MCY9522295.1 beta-lactamase family protein [Paenibacillus apiarius]MCY9555400.1 beta-lactamase family protein [Paenibacillus apiarius]MCY9560208.1 beta-lactamase family protein [Paenibacillus apiarius]MCY9683826.1 beta-lactamase family protein [Paenibacillus apiarius]
MKKMVSILMTAMLIAIPATPAFAQLNNDTVKEKAQGLASKIVSDYGVSGLQYAIMDHGSIVLSDSAGVYDKATKDPITKDTMLGIGSVSKMYVSAATMMLADSKKIDIDKPLITYIKDFKMADERYKKITPRMLMNHSSGLYGSHYENGFLFNDNDTKNHDELLVKLQSEVLKSNPGELAVYCNDGFQLLEILIERVSGLSYSEFLETFISKPLHLSSTKTPRDSFERDKLAKTYFPAIDQALPVENVNLIGTGGIYSTAEEVVKFADVLIGNRTDILSEKSAKAMQSHEYRKGVWVSEETNTINYGLGWDAVRLAPFSDYGITALSKGGDTQLYHANLTTLPEHDISIAVLSSGGSSIYNSILASNVLLEYARTKGIIKELLPEKTFEPPLKVDMPSDLLAYSGLYGTVGKTVNLEVKNGEIDLPALVGGAIPPQKYVYTGNGQFKNNDGNVAISFDQQKNGKTYLKVNSNLNFPGLGQTVMVMYEYQKLDSNPLNQSTKTVWEHRNGKNYYALDEKITSVKYLIKALLAKNISVDINHGYASGTKIVDKNKAVNVTNIPIMNGRDVFDLNFYNENHAEHLVIDGQSYISEDAIQPIYEGNDSFCNIPSNGQAVWYKIDEKSANKKMTVDIPLSGGFAVYDETGKVVEFSTVSNNHSVVLPKGGLIVFGGTVGDVFKINLNNK